jgi:hypothetical protein
MSDVTLTCTVGGVSVALYSKVQVSERANQRTTASFGIVDTTNTLNIRQNMKVVLQENGVNKFVGYVDTADRRVIVAPTSLISIYDVTCKDTQYLSDKMVYTGDELTGVTSGDAVALIHQNALASQGVTANYQIDRDADLATWTAGTHSNTQATANGLTLANAGSPFVITETTTSDFNNFTSLSNLATYNTNLQLNGTNAIKLQGTANALAGANLFAYYKIFTFSGRVVSNGDLLTYGIWINGDSPQMMGGVDLIFSDGSTLRDGSTPALDQSQIGSHPHNDLGGLANDQWYWRTIQIPSIQNGKTVKYAVVALEGDQAGTYTVYMRDIHYCNSSFIVLDNIFNAYSSIPVNKLGSVGYDNLSISIVQIYEQTGIRVSPAYTNSACNILRQSLMSWTADLPKQTSASSTEYPPQIVMEVSYDNGFTWLTCTNKQPIPNMMPGMSVSGKVFKIRQTLNVGGPNPEYTPVLHDCTLTLVPSYVSTKNDVIISSLAGDASMATGTNTRLTNSSTLGLYMTGQYKQWAFGNTGSQSIFSSVTAAPASQSTFVHTLQMRVTGAGDGKIKMDWAGTFADFVLDIDVNPHNSDGIYGVVYRTTSWVNANDTYGYFVGIDMVNQLLVLGHGTNSTGSTWTQVATALGSYTADTTYHMQLVISGTSHQIYIDGVLLINVTDSFTTAAGYVGVRYYNGTTNRESAFWADIGIISGTNLTSTRLWPSTSVSSVGIVESSVIQWNADVPDSCTLDIQVSLDAGATYTSCTNGATIPGCTQGANLAGKSLLIKANFTTTNAAQTPVLWGLTAVISSDFQSSGNRKSPVMNVSSLGYVGSSSFTWVADVPANTTLVGKTTLDNSTYTTVTSGSAVAGLTSQPAQVSDTFTTNTSANYSLTFQAGGSIPTLTYDTPNSKLTISGGVTGHARWTLANTVVNGTLTALVATSDKAGFLFRYSDTSNYYRVILTDSLAASNQQKATIVRCLTGTITQIGQVSIDFVRNTYHTMIASAVGNVITLSWDGIQVFTYTDATPVAGVGGAGLYSDGGSMVVYKLVMQGNGALATSTTVGSQLLLTSSDPLYTPLVHEAVLNVRGPQLETGNVLQATNYAYAQATSNIADAAKQSNMLWKINPDMSLTLYGRTSRLAAWPAWTGVKADGTSDVMESNAPKLSAQSPLYRNRQYVTNAYQLVNMDEQMLGNGYASSWPLALPVDSVTSFQVNGQDKTVSLGGSSGFDFYINGTVLSQDAAAPLLTDEQVITIVYVGKEPYVAMKENTVSQALLATYDLVPGGYSVVAMVEDGGGCDNVAADALAQARIDQYSILSRDWEFTTRRSGLAVGTILTSFAPEYGLVDFDALITAITTDYVMHGSLSSPIYDIQTSEGPAIGTWTRLFIPT